ncbi:response regulator transcription factor [Nonomuraea mesophila]|uniref:response regulator transcription factor n=1 Tax=Nonomuraea mesophila TaxID=2530382 RepID=UPI0015F2D1D2|nr:response regulator transcription factor [Nonomuraea mesophila]
MYRQGVAAVLSTAGYVVESPADLLAWVRQERRGVVLLTLVREQDWELLGRLRDTGGAHGVIVLLVEESAVLGTRAVRAGARSVLPREVTATALRRTVEATFDGQAVLPAEVVTALVTGVHQDGTSPGTLSPHQLSWLRQLAGGATVAELAGRAGYSERAMFRLLQALYREMGVTTRIQAIVRAQERGWLAAVPDRTETAEDGLRNVRR